MAGEVTLATLKAAMKAMKAVGPPPKGYIFSCGDQPSDPAVIADGAGGWIAVTTCDLVPDFVREKRFGRIEDGMRFVESPQPVEQKPKPHWQDLRGRW